MAKDGVSMEKMVILYTDKPENEFDYSTDKLSTILRYFRAENWDFIHAKPTTGFESGVNWEELKNNKEIVAVVLFDINDACVYGIYAEAYLGAGLSVYEIFEDQLLGLDDLYIAGKNRVLCLSM